MKKIATIFVLFLILPGLAIADVIILKSGDKFTTRKSWEENGKIKFYMKGLVVGIDKKKVARIIKSGSSGQTKKPSPKSEPKSEKKEKTTLEPNESSKQATKAGPGKKKPDKKSERIAPEENIATRPVEKPRAPKKPAESSSPGKAPIPKMASRQPRPKEEIPAGSVGYRGLTWNLKVTEFKKQKKGSDSIFGGIAPFFLPKSDVKPGEFKTETDPAFGGVVQYYLPKKEYRFGRVDVDGVTYGFWREQFLSITIWTEGLSNYKALRKAVFNQYGEGWRNNKNVERWVWLDDSTQRMLEYDSDMESGMLVLMNRRLHRKIKTIYDLD